MGVNDIIIDHLVTVAYYDLLGEWNSLINSKNYSDLLIGIDSCIHGVDTP
jgi:hypothetical protein